MSADKSQQERRIAPQLEDLPLAADESVEQPNHQPAAEEARATIPDSPDLTGGPLQ